MIIIHERSAGISPTLMMKTLYSMGATNQGPSHYEKYTKCHVTLISYLMDKNLNHKVNDETMSLIGVKIFRKLQKILSLLIERDLPPVEKV